MFGNYPQVSITETYDRIVLNFLDNFVLTALDGDPISNSSLWLSHKIPK